jgi:hypothetical protein
MLPPGACRAFNSHARTGSKHVVVIRLSGKLRAAELWYVAKSSYTTHACLDGTDFTSCDAAEVVSEAYRGISCERVFVQIVLYAILSFIREIFLGQQGVLTMMADK